MKRETLDQLNAARSAKKPVILATWLDDGSESLIFEDSQVQDRLAEAVTGAFATDRSTTIEVNGRPLFLHVFNPPLRMIVVGAVHVAEPLAKLAQTVGYDITVIDPRRAYVSAERFPGVSLIDHWPDDAITELAPDHRTAIATLTHDPKIDDPALHVALKSSVFYIGSLGSKRTHAKRVDRLLEAGFADQDIARINAPVGLDIGSSTPPEIALSVMAEVVAAQRGKLP